MPLEKQIVEIPLNAGMNTKANADLQSVDTMRAVTNLRFDGQGELRKRPTYDATDDRTISAPTGSSYGVGTPSGVFARGDAACVLTQHHGIVEASEGLPLAHFYRDVAVSSARDEDGLKYTPVACDVSRRFLHATQLGAVSGGIANVCSAVYNDETMVIAWYEHGATPFIACRAYDLASGRVVASTEYVTTVGLTFDAVEYTEASKEGVLIAYTTGIVAPITVATIRYDAATGTFVTDSNLSTNLAGFGFGLAKVGDEVVFAFRDNTTGFLKAQLRTIGSVTLTHDGTTASGRFVVLAGTADVLIVHSTTSNVYAETLGTPGSITTLLTASSENFWGLHASIESGVKAVVCVNAEQTTTPPNDTYYVARWRYLDFTGGTITNVTSGRLPHALHVGASFVHDGRAYHMFAFAHDLEDEAPTTSGIVARFHYSADLPRWNPVARICHDRLCVYDEFSLIFGGNGGAIVGDTAYIVSLADRSEAEPDGLTTAAPQTIFLSAMKLGTLPNVVEADKGVALGSTGLLWEHDGLTPAEAQPLNRPRVDGTSNTGTGTTLTSGISVIAIYRWVDNAGRLHRSAPSEAHTVGAITDKSIVIYVSKPPFASYDGAAQIEYMEPELYATADGGSTYYMCLVGGGPKHVYDASLTAWWRFDDVQPGSNNGPQLYSDGGSAAELVSEPPPAFCSIARIGDRVWGIDAEDRSRVWYSKPLVAGYAVEWNTANTLIIGDEGVAVVDSGGVPTVFGKAGIWQIHGDGPDAVGVGSFSPARRLPVDVACTSSTGVARTPMGVVFRGRRGVYLLGGGGDVQPLGLPIDPELRTPVDSSAGECRVVYDEFHNEIRVIDSSQGLFVYNMLEQKWTEWTQSTTYQYQLDACVAAGRVWYLHDASGSYALRREKGIDESGHNESDEPWEIELPWLSPGGITGFGRIWRAHVTVRLGTYPERILPLRLTVRTRGPVEDTSFYEWYDTDITDYGESGDVIDLRAVLRQQKSKAFKFTIREECNGNMPGSVPLALRLEIGVDPARRGSSSPLGGTVAS